MAVLWRMGGGKKVSEGITLEAGGAVVWGEAGRRWS